ncbi:hypothetical protein MNV49_004241 [Pseudohyphozyma bogoriensis]|nr:hypothetical protein MNV49_004241 [Pseudohyphozyma bogoriensis]
MAKLLKSYKRLTLAVESFDDATLPASLDILDYEDDVQKLRLWSEAARSKWSLTQRVISARDEHHRAFYQGGDWGHTTFIETLKVESARLERMLRKLDRRAYSVTLVNSQAEWVLDAPAVGFICEEPAPVIETPPTPPTTPPTSETPLPGLTKNQRKKAQRKARKGSVSPDDPFLSLLSPTTRQLTAEEKLARLRDYLVPPALPPSVQPSTWHALVATLFRHVILRVHSLAPLALESINGRRLNTVEEFLDVLEERMHDNCGSEVERLWSALKFARSSEKEGHEGLLGVGVLGDAIADVLRSEEDDGLHINILGGKVFKQASTAPLSDEGWDLFYQFVSCSGCSLSITRTYGAWTRNRRLALLGAYPAYMSTGESPVEHIFRAASMVLCSSNSGNGCGKRVKRVEQKESSMKRGKAKKTVLVEEWERAWMYVKLPLDNEWASKILAALEASPKVALLARDTVAGTLTHRPSTNPVDPEERRQARWTTNTFFATETVMESFSKNSSPERRFGFEYACHDLLVLDERPYHASSGDYDSFAAIVGDLVMEARGEKSAPASYHEHGYSGAEVGEKGGMDDNYAYHAYDGNPAPAYEYQYHAEPVAPIVQAQKHEPRRQAPPPRLQTFAPPKAALIEPPKSPFLDGPASPQAIEFGDAQLRKPRATKLRPESQINWSRFSVMMGSGEKKRDGREKSSEWLKQSRGSSRRWLALGWTSVVITLLGVAGVIVWYELFHKHTYDPAVVSIPSLGGLNGGSQSDSATSTTSAPSSSSTSKAKRATHHSISEQRHAGKLRLA